MPKEILITGANHLSQQLRDDMVAFGRFIGADTIEFVDKGNLEMMIIHKRNKTFTILACGNRFDGGFFGYRR